MEFWRQHTALGPPIIQTKIGQIYPKTQGVPGLLLIPSEINAFTVTKQSMSLKDHLDFKKASVPNVDTVSSVNKKKAQRLQTSALVKNMGYFFFI